MNITTREQFNALLHDLRTQSIMTFDSETNGLFVYLGHRPISMSFYFPEVDHSYNFAFAHGVGEIELPNKNLSQFHEWSWAGKDKKQAYKSYFFDKYRRQNPEAFGNLPADWLDELRQVWNTRVTQNVKVVYFNAPFDIHMMESIGFNQPQLTEDVLIAVHLVFEDWRHPSIGGTNQLKWQANYWKIPGALDGEADLARQSEALATRVAELVAANWSDPINATFHKLKRPARVDEIAKRLKFDPKSEMWCLPSWAVAKYAENDTKITWLLREKLLEMLKPWDQIGLYHDLSAVQNEFLIRMERNGVLLDRKRTEELIDEMKPVMGEVNDWFKDELAKALEEVEPEQRQIYEPIVQSFSVSSNAKLPAALSLLTGVNWVSTDKDAVLRYEDEYGEHPAIEKLKHFRHAQRAVQTYLRKWLQSQDESGYIHGSFNINGTKTGRCSSSSGTLGDVGNYQNIPTRGFRIKECMITPPGWGLFQIDYGQLELRLASWIAGCETMIQMFENGVDLHAYTRDQANIGEILYGGMDIMEAAEAAFSAGKLKTMPEDEEAAQRELQNYYRQVAKTLNFGLLYGGTWRMVNRLLRVGERAARELHSAWNSLYPEYSAANEKWKADALTRRPRPDGTGGLLYVIQPISGRTRKFGLYPISEEAYDPKTGNRWISPTREMQAKDAFNFAVQGLGGYIMLMSSLRMAREFDNSIFRPFANIHDSIVFYLRHGHFDVLPRMVEIMTDWDVRPRLTVDVEYAPDGVWQHLEKAKELSEIALRGAA